MASPYLILGAIIGALFYWIYTKIAHHTPAISTEEVMSNTIRDFHWALEYCECPSTEDRDDWIEDYKDSKQSYRDLCKACCATIKSVHNPADN
jgi:hypothetical protein